MKKIITTVLLATLFASCSLGLSQKWSVKQWDIQGYKVIYMRKLDWAGPHYYQYDVYKNGRFISFAQQDSNDSCKLGFEENRERYLYFNLCAGTAQAYTDTKAPIDVQAFDSMVIKGNNGTILKPTKHQMRKYARMWNRAKPNGFRRLGTPYDYEFTVYSKGIARNFRMLNNYVTEDGNWSYQFKWKAFFEQMRKKATE